MLEPALLVKLLFPMEPLSIQVHPNDAFARSIGLPNGKTEAWYILSAEPDAAVAVGLIRKLTQQELRTAIADGSIAELVRWRHVRAGDVVFVPAGTIHAIGPGCVIAEVQQSSDTTFRLFDYGRHRELHIDNAVAAADTGPAERQVASSRLTDARTLLVACPYFVVERLDLPPGSSWRLDVIEETWLLTTEGHAQVGRMNASTGDAYFLKSEQIVVETGRGGFSCLVAYAAARPWSDLLTALSVTASVETRT